MEKTTEQTQEATQTVAVVKSVWQRVPNVVKALSKIEEKAVAFDQEAITTGTTMMDILSGKTKQTPENDMVTLSKNQQRAQAKASGIRSKGRELAAELAEMGAEITAEIERLTAAYADSSIPESPVDEEEDLDEDGLEEDGLEEDEDGIDPDDDAGL